MKTPGEQVLYLVVYSTQRLVQDRIRNYFQKYLPASLEITDEVVAAAGVAPGTPKFQKAKEEMILTRLDARPKKPEPVPEPPSASADVELRAGAGARAPHARWCRAVRSLRGPYHWDVQPPSIRMSVPVINPASSEHRNRASFPISSGRPHRPTGILVRNWRFSSTSLIRAVFSSVANGPGLMPTTVIPSPASSCAKARVSPSSPDLLAE